MLIAYQTPVFYLKPIEPSINSTQNVSRPRPTRYSPIDEQVYHRVISQLGLEGMEKLL